jgi:hypothetical protein
MTDNRPWTIRDIRTGRAIGKTRDPLDLMFAQLTQLRQHNIPHYFAIGNIRHQDLKESVNLLREHGITVVRDRQLPPDMLLLFEGSPDELGFAKPA